MRNLLEEIERYFVEYYKDWSGSGQFRGSGKRLERLVDEMCWSNEVVEEEVNKCFLAVFPDEYDEMLVVRDVEVWTLCPHHLLPCEFRVSIGYIPAGKVLGLSKFARVAVIMGKRPTMQEQYTRELADVLEEHLEPQGLGVVVIGKHGCMGCRGVKQELSVSTSVLKGLVKTDGVVREEFYATCK